MRKLPKCNSCQLYSHSPYLICAIHPSGLNEEAYPDFAPTATAAMQEQWLPVGASDYGGELVLLMT